ncbi:MAG: hypothetical protein AB7I48_24720 [Planctomycetaceae bacterium]
MAVNGIDDATNSMEARLPDLEEPLKLKLKNGSEVDAFKAYSVWRLLVIMESEAPKDLSLFSAFARHGENKLHPKSRDALRNRWRGWFTPEGTLDPVARDVVLSAYRETGDGPVVVEPFHLEKRSDVEAFKLVERQFDQATRLVRNLALGDDFPPKGKSR